MDRKRSRVLMAGTLVLVLVLLLGLMAGGVADAKKKKKKRRSRPVTTTVSRTVGTQIPDAAPAAPNAFGKLVVPLEFAGTQLKKKVVGNVEVTFQTTGAVADAANDLVFRLTAPAGRTIQLRPDLGTLGGTSIGPLTLTPNSAAGTCNTPMPPCADPDQTLNRPFQGTAGQTGLAQFNGLPITGTWNFSAYDTVNMKTSVLNSARVTISSARPVT